MIFEEEDVQRKCEVCGHKDPVPHGEAHLRLCGSSCPCASGTTPLEAATQTGDGEEDVLLFGWSLATSMAR